MIVNEDILFYAFRYFLGRKTYAVSETVNALKENWNMLSSNSKKIIIQEIEDARNEDGLGMECDKKQWLSLLNYSFHDNNEGDKK